MSPRIIAVNLISLRQDSDKLLTHGAVTEELRGGATAVGGVQGCSYSQWGGLTGEGWEEHPKRGGACGGGGGATGAAVRRRT